MKLFFGSTLFLILPVTLSLVGCASQPLDQAPFFEILETRAPDSAVTSDLFLLDNPMPRQYLVVKADEESREIRQSHEVTERFQSEWKVVEGDDRDRFFRQDESGDILLAAVIEHGENAISLFNPPLVAAYHRLEPGESRTQDVAMKVVNLSNPSRLREFGRAQQTITYLEDCQIRLQWGTFAARRLSVIFDAELKLAQVHVETILYVVPGYGVLIEETKKTIKILGIIPKYEDSMRILIGPDKAKRPL